MAVSNLEGPLERPLASIEVGDVERSLGRLLEQVAPLVLRLEALRVVVLRMGGPRQNRHPGMF